MQHHRMAEKYHRGAYETVQHRTGVSHTGGIATANLRGKRNVPEAEHTITGERR